ncbi:hypothetical protein ANDA3_3280 [plant metagenome]|uniref:Uncharacterized protein n=2 Tax=root TaxID=1 RepID=A0A1C3K5D9_9BURK|nr:hypothetical protein ODI_02301 [Orrella dioscoreae]
MFQIISDGLLIPPCFCANFPLRKPSYRWRCRRNTDRYLILDKQACRADNTGLPEQRCP